MKAMYLALLLCTVVGALSLPAIGLAQNSAAAEKLRAGDAQAPFAVVELFTSEGCSSCPDADKVLAELASDDVFVLSFHVDYWDDLGWKDPFSSKQATARQRAYAKKLKRDGLYTPQMVVDGVVEFVGSNQAKAQAAVATAKRFPSHVQLTLDDLKSDGDNLNVKYQVAKLTANPLLNLALVRRESSSKVTAGENIGRTLPHAHSVQTFLSKEIAKNSAGDASIALPPGTDSRDLLLIAYLQDSASWQILVAAKAAVP